MGKKPTKVPVTKRALVQRINRKLWEYQKLCAARGAQKAVLGEFYVLDLDSRKVLQTHVDLEKFGRREGCLDPHEELAN